MCDRCEPTASVVTIDHDAEVIQYIQALDARAEPGFGADWDGRGGPPVERALCRQKWTSGHLRPADLRGQADYLGIVTSDVCVARRIIFPDKRFWPYRVLRPQHSGSTESVERCPGTGCLLLTCNVGGGFYSCSQGVHAYDGDACAFEEGNHGRTSRCSGGTCRAVVQFFGGHPRFPESVLEHGQ